METFKELLALNKEQLEKKLDSMRKQLVELNMQLRVSGLDKPHQIGVTKREISRLTHALGAK
jgi:ribosomal protein L29